VTSAIENLEKKLDSFELSERQEALRALWEMARSGEISLPEPGSYVNLHCHTFFSYNSYGYSPAKFAWLARKAGLTAAGIVDFDVLDGLEEFLDTAGLIGLKAVAGMETRVFIPEFADREINSPGEPGISYHMGVGFPTSDFSDADKGFLLRLRQIVGRRNRDLTARVNKHLSPVELDYDNDVIPLTPSGNPTERHICLAFARKARALIGNNDKLAEFWSEKLGVDADTLDLPEGSELQGMIRLKTMKRGGVGYVVPDKGSFPQMAETNRFILSAGAIPTITWLNGLSDGEQAIEELLEIAMKSGVSAINIIPDRNYTPNVKDEKLKNLYEIVELAEKLNLPVIVGTEMNSPGQKFVDYFDSKELSPLVPVFLRGAYIVYAHSALQRQCGLGYTSDWAREHFPAAADRNRFYEAVGKKLQPDFENIFEKLNKNTNPEAILDTLNN